MTALAEIQSAIRQAGPVPDGYARSVLIGPSARASIVAQACVDNDPPNVPSGIMGTPVAETEMFPGWALVEKPLPAAMRRK